MKVRFRFLFSTLIVLILATAGLADEVEDIWKNLVMQALYAAGSNDYAKAETLLVKALHEAERFGSSDPRVGTTSNSLGLVYRSEKKFPLAEAAFQRALTILDAAYGPESLDVANIDYNIASTMVDEGKFGPAVPNILKSIDLYSRLLGGQSLKTAAAMCAAGEAYKGIRDWANAEKYLKRCGEIREADGGIVNKDFGDAMNSLASVYQQAGKTAQADSTYKLAEGIREKTYGITSQELADSLEAHAAVLKQLGRDKDAERDSALASAIRKRKK